MVYVPLCRAEIVMSIAGLLDRAGAPVDRVLATAGLPPWANSDPELLVPSRSIGRLLSVAAEDLDRPNFGLSAGELAGVGAVGKFGRLVRSAPTLGAALHTAARMGSTGLSSYGR